MSFPFCKQIENVLKELSTQVRTLTKENQQQRLMLQELTEQVQKQRADFVRALQPRATPVSSKNLGELHALDLQKARIAKSTIVDYGTNHNEVDKSFKAADQERNEAQEDLGAAIESVFFSSSQDTDEIPKFEKEEEEEDNPPEAAV